MLSALPVVTRDIAGIVGSALVSYGGWLIYHPAGYIIGGALLMAGSFLLARAD